MATLEAPRRQPKTFAVSLAVLCVLFAILFRWFPDAEVEWAAVWPGASASAPLFNIGKLAISWYIGTHGLESTYGAAASIVLMLIRVYSSARIVRVGAQVSHAYAGHRRRDQGHPDPAADH